jgi:hypothetical protein
MILMLSLLALPGCAHNAGTTDTFCLFYTPVVQAPGDTIKAPLAVKKRILSNELKYEECGK